MLEIDFALEALRRRPISVDEAMIIYQEASVWVDVRRAGWHNREACLKVMHKRDELEVAYRKIFTERR